MDIKDEVKNVVVTEAKSAYYKGRVVGAALEIVYKLTVRNGRFLMRYIKELRKK